MSKKRKRHKPSQALAEKFLTALADGPLTVSAVAEAVCGNKEDSTKVHVSAVLCALKAAKRVRRLQIGGRRVYELVPASAPAAPKESA